MEIESLWSTAPVTSICYVPKNFKNEKTVILGQGQFVVLVDVETGVVRDRCQVFKSAVVHSLQMIDNSRIMVRGGKSIVIFNINESSRFIILIEEKLQNDWIIASLFNQENIWTLSAHNKLTKCDNNVKPVSVMDADCGPCILYSGFIHRVNEDKVIVLAGTVFGNVLIWHCDTGAVVSRLSGHDGVIFSVNLSDNIIVTTSDDRSSIVYTVKDEMFTDVQQLYRLHGHSYRVFRSLLSVENDIVVTAGEDGRVITWSLSSGQEIDRSNLASCVWSVSWLGPNDIICGAGDCSLSVINIRDSEKKPLSIPFDHETNKPRIVKCVADVILTMDDDGNLSSFNTKTKEHNTLYSDTRLASYCLMEVSGEQVTMCGLSGLVVTGYWSPMNYSLDNIEEKQVMNTKIFSCCIVIDKILVCDNQGSLVMVDKSLETVATGELPLMKERWFTASCFLDDILVLGDRSGGLHFYQIVKSQIEIMETYPRLHGRHGVTSIVADDGLIWSSGRDATLRCFSVTDGIQLMQTVKTSHDWVAGIRRIHDQLSVLMWHGTQLLARTLCSDSLIGSFDCGGGHRSWDLLASGDIGYIKDGKVLLGSLWTNQKRVLIAGGHSQQINAVVQFNGFIITGSEDTNIRVYRDKEQVSILRGHLSSIKCLHLVNDVKNINRKILVSGGGRAELRMWSLVIKDSKLCCDNLASVMVREGGGGKGNKKAWKQLQASVILDGETRFMSIDSRWDIENNLVLYVGCSDSYIRVYRWSHNQDNIEFINQVIHHSHCLLQLRLVPEKNMIVTGTTGGHLTVWDMESLDVVTETFVHQSGVNCLEILSRDHQDGVLIVTGGDDTKLVVTKCSDVNHLTVLWRNDNVGHTTQLTGVKLVNDYLISTGVDQRVIVWRLNPSSGQVTWLVSKCVCVADISDMDCWEDEQGFGDKSEPCLNIVIVGVGMEKLDYKLNPSKQLL